MGRHGWLPLAIATAAAAPWAVPSAALAAADAPSKEPPATAAGNREPRAERLFREAVASAQAGQYRQAVERFEQSYALDPARGTLQGMAMAHEGAGQYAKAYQRYAQLHEEAQATGDTRRKKVAESRMRALRGRVAVVELEPEPSAGTTVTVDGEQVELHGGRLALAPGRHDLSQGGESQTIDVEPGEQRVVSFTPGPGDTASQPAVPNGQDGSQDDEGYPFGAVSITALAATGISVGLVTAGTVLFVQAGATYDDVSGQCPDNRCPAAQQDRLERDIADGRDTETAGQALLGVGIIVATAAVGMWAYDLLYLQGDGSGQGSARIVVSPTYLGIRGEL